MIQIISIILSYLNLIILYFIVFLLYKKINKSNSNSTEEIDYESILKKHMRSSIVWPLPDEKKINL